MKTRVKKTNNWSNGEGAASVLATIGAGALVAHLPCKENKKIFVNEFFCCA